MRRDLALVPLALAAAACFPAATLTAAGREQVARALTAQPRYLRVAAYVGPFFGDGSRLLLGDRPPAELAALLPAGGAPLAPPPAARILGPGTAVFVDAVEFPTGPALWTRPQATPRQVPWLLARVQGEERTAVVVLAGRSSDPEDVLAEAGRLLSSDDPTPAFRQLPDVHRAAVLRKEVVEGMGRPAAAMAWGSPDRVVVDPAARSEEWLWAGGRRRALFQDERLVRFEVARPPGDGPPGPPPAAPAPVEPAATSWPGAAPGPS
jgi:hypothetical protein